MPVEIENFWFKAEDGLRLHAIEARPSLSYGVPILCLAGISRTTEDFRTLLTVLAGDLRYPRRALALDSRGRGLSERDQNPQNYSVAVELRDLISFLCVAQIKRAIFVGTSRGGILTMLLASVMPQVIAGAVLNDVGPALEMTGLLRIKSYVGKIPPPRSGREAVESLKKAMGNQFPGFSDNDWEMYAHRTWNDDFSPRADPAISIAFNDLDPLAPPPTLWPQFDALAASAPVLVLRGENSDLLSRETVTSMTKRGERVEAIEIASQGHAPILEHRESIQPIIDFAARCDPPPFD